MPVIGKGEEGLGVTEQAGQGWRTTAWTGPRGTLSCGELCDVGEGDGQQGL